MSNISIAFNNKSKCSISKGYFSYGKFALENNKREVLRKIRGTDGKYHERNPGEVEEDFKNIQLTLHYCVQQGQTAVCISIGWRQNPVLGPGIPVCLFGDMAGLRKSMEQLKFVSITRSPLQDINFMYYKLHHECWYDSVKDQMDELHTGGSHS